MSLDLKFAQIWKQIVVYADDPTESLYFPEDSGALVVENKKDCPAPVGVAFYGSSSAMVVNPIDKVLSEAKKLKPKGKKTVVGCDSAAAASSNRRDTAERRAERVAERAQLRLHRQIADLDGFVGTGISADEVGNPTVFVALARDDEELRDRIPREINGVPTDVWITGAFVAASLALAKK